MKEPAVCAVLVLFTSCKTIHNSDLALIIHVTCTIVFIYYYRKSPGVQVVNNIIISERVQSFHWFLPVYFCTSLLLLVSRCALLYYKVAKNFLFLWHSIENLDITHHQSPYMRENFCYCETSKFHTSFDQIIQILLLMFLCCKKTGWSLVH